VSEPNCTFREYRPDDRQQVELCVVELQNFERRLEPCLTTGEQMAASYLRRLLQKIQDKSGSLTVSLVGDTIAGFVSSWCDGPEDPLESDFTCCGYIGELVVLPQYRGLGIGKALMERAESFLLAHNPQAIYIEVLSRNSAAVELYRNLGFRHNKLRLIKEIER